MNSAVKISLSPIAALLLCCLAVQTRAGQPYFGPTVEPKGPMRPSAEVPEEAIIFKDFPITGVIDMELNGKNLTNARPWHAYDGEMVTLYGYADYEAINELVNDVDFTPYKTIIDNQTLGFLQFTIVTYYSSNSGAYHELVLSTPVAGFGAESAYDEEVDTLEGCDLDGPQCLYIKYFLYKGIKWYVMQMWLNEELPVATGNQLSGIQKVFSPDLNITIEHTDTGNKWHMVVEDDPSDTHIDAYFTDTFPTVDPMLQVMANFDMELVNGVIGKPGMPKDMVDILQTVERARMEPYHNNYLVEPKGAYPPYFGTEVNPISQSMLATGSPAEDENGNPFYGEYLTPDCELNITFGGYLSKLKFIGDPDCYFIHNTQAVICPPSNVGPFTEMCKNITWPWKEFEDLMPAKDPADIVKVDPIELNAQGEVVPLIIVDPEAVEHHEFSADPHDHHKVATKHALVLNEAMAENGSLISNGEMPMEETSAGRRLLRDMPI